MCQLKSAIVLKDKVFMPWDTDKHEDMIAELKLDDKTKSPDFVRVEISPADGNVFNHDLKNWVLKVDQDFKPEWWSEKFAEEECREQLKQWFKERFLVSGKIDKIDKGKWFLGGSAQVQNIYGSAQVQNIYGRSVCCFTGNKATYKTVKENGVVILYYKDNPEIVVANKKIKLVQFKEKKSGS